MANANDFFPSKYLKASDLQGKSIVATVADVKFEGVGQEKEMKPILYFAGKDKGLVLNKTNTNKIIESAGGSTDTEDWTGLKLLVYPSETEYQGKTVDCIRLKAAPKGAAEAEAPATAEAAPNLTEDDIPF